MKQRPQAGFIAQSASIVPTWPAVQCRARPTTARFHRATTHAQRAHAAHSLTGPRCMRPRHAGSAHALPCAVVLHRWHDDAGSGWRQAKRWQATACDGGKRQCKGSGEALTGAQGRVDGVARRRTRCSYGF
jgi:hypothetical protein